MRKILIALPLFILLAGCWKTPCAKADLHFGLISFQDTEADSITIRKFIKAGNFATLLDSVITDISFTRNNDTLEVATYSINSALFGDYDYQLYFPVSGNVYSVTEIHEEKSEIGNSIFNTNKMGCGNIITSLKLNGQFIQPEQNYFYLHR